MNTSFITLENSQVRLGPGVCGGNGKKGTTKQRYKKECVSRASSSVMGRMGQGIFVHLFINILIYSFIFISVLGWPRDLLMLGKISITELHSQFLRF